MPRSRASTTACCEEPAFVQTFLHPKAIGAPCPEPLCRLLKSLNSSPIPGLLRLLLKFPLDRGIFLRGAAEVRRSFRGLGTPFQWHFGVNAGNAGKSFVSELLWLL